MTSLPRLVGSFGGDVTNFLRRPITSVATPTSRRYHMRTHRRFGVIVLVLIAMLAGSGVAWAQTDEDDVIEIEAAEDVTDTLFNLGYDPFNRLLLWNLSALDGIYDCTLE